MTFNLIDELWIPCLLTDNSRVELSLDGVLTQAQQIREIYGQSPLVISALHRLLLAILYATYQPYKRRDWLRIRTAGNFVEASTYLRQWHDRFFLHHPIHPFFQTIEEIGKPQTLAGLTVERARGNNATLFDHSRDAEMLVLSAGEAACALLAGQYYPLGGGISGIKGKNFTDATLTRGVAFLAQGETLFETLLFNLVPFEHLPNLFRKHARNADENEDRPIWERSDPFASDRTIPNGIIDYLTWQSRRLKLIPGDAGQVAAMYRSQGQALDSETTRDPYKLYYTSKKQKLTPLLFRKDKALWRDSQTLFRIHETSVEPPVSFTWLDTLCKRKELSQGEKLRCMALGMSTEPGKATIYFTRHEQLPLPLKILDADATLLKSLTEALTVAEKIAYGLRDAAKAIGVYQFTKEDELKDEKGNWKGWWKVKVSKTAQEEITVWVDSLQLLIVYWERLGGYFSDYLVRLTDAENQHVVQTQWKEMVRLAAESAFNTINHSLADQTPRTRHATVVGRSWLYYKLNQLVPQEQDNDQK